MAPARTLADGTQGPWAHDSPGPWSIAVDDPLARHKTLNYWSKRRAHEIGCANGADEVLLASADGAVWEGSRMNLFLVNGSTLVTPGPEGPFLPGIQRGLVLELARRIGFEVIERRVTWVEIDAADEVFLTNAVQGIVPVAKIHNQGRTYPSPGPTTARLQDRFVAWIEAGGGSV